MHNGYIKLWRKIMHTSFYKTPTTLQMAIHLLLKANHIPHKFIWNGKAEVIKTGQILTGRKILSQETGQSEQQVRTSLSTLSDPTVEFITIKSTNRFSVISIVRYEDYQGESTNTLTNKQPTSNQQATTNKNDKNDKNEKKGSVPPTIEQVREYCKESKGRVNADKFFSHYKATGWKIGGSLITDWKAAVDKWEHTEFERKEIAEHKKPVQRKTPYGTGIIY